MNEREIKKRVFQLIEKYSEVKIKAETLLRDEAGLDSMDQVQICMDLESEFNLRIEDDELFTTEIENATAGEIVEKVIAKLKEQDVQQEETSEEEIEGQQVTNDIQDLKGIAEEYLYSKAKVWCHNRNCWETNSLTMLPDGNFVDEKGFLHLKKSHTAYVTLDDAMEAVRTTLTKLLNNKELELEKLKQDPFLTEKLRELSLTQEQIGRDSVYK